MAIQTGQRTTETIAQSQKTVAEKPAPEKAAPKKSAPRKKGKIEVEIANNPFTPGEKVQIHSPLAVDVQRREGREPQAKPVSTGTASKDGTFSADGLEPGAYLAYGEDSHAYLGFTAK